MSSRDNGHRTDDSAVAFPGTIAMVISSMSGGGAQRVVATLASGIAARGHDVDLVVAQARGPFLKDLHPNVRVVDLNTRRVATATVPLARYLRRERPAVIFSALDYVNVVTIVARALAGVDAPLVVSEHNTLSQAVAHTAKRRTRWMPHFIRWTYPHADRVVAVSSGVAQDLVRMCSLAPDSVTVLNNPIVSPEMLRLRRQPVEHPWLLERTVPVLVAVGRLYKQKDFSTLIEAFAIARRTRDARLIIFGEGPLRAELEGHTTRLGVEEDVSLPGFSTNPYASMAAADAFVLSSAWEGSPTVLVEAMSCGTPVVATDCPSGPREILDGGRHGALVPVGDPEALASAMIAVLEGRVAPPAPGSWVPFTQDSVVADYLGLFSEVVR